MAHILKNNPVDYQEELFSLYWERIDSDPVRLLCKRCGREWMYHGRNPCRARCTYRGTTVTVWN